jgi:hypothetical protein
LYLIQPAFKPVLLQLFAAVNHRGPDLHLQFLLGACL